MAKNHCAVSGRHREDGERIRLGRELHDSTSQHLVAADLCITSVLHASDISSENRERLREAQASLSAAQKEIRSFAYFLHQPDLGELGLAKAVERFCDGFSRRSGLAIAVSIKDLPDSLPPEVEHTLFRLCQESIMNVYRHAHARNINIRLALIDKRLIMEVRDDGQGVDNPERFERGGMGIAAMQARLRSVNGDLRLEDAAPGIAVIASVPVSARPHGASRLREISRRLTNDRDVLAVGTPMPRNGVECPRS